MNYRFTLSSVCAPMWSLDELLDLAGALGFPAIETFTTWTKAKVGPESHPSADLASTFAKHGVELGSLNVINLQDMSVLPRLQAEMEYARSLGLSHVNLKGGARIQPWDEFFELLHRALKTAAANSLSINLGNHPGNRIENSDDFGRVLNAIDDPSLRILADTGHFYTVGDTPLKVIERWPDRIGLVHLNDRRNGRGVALGTGDLQIEAVLQSLARANYRGDLVFELETDEEIGRDDALEILRAAKALITDHLASPQSWVG